MGICINDIKRIVCDGYYSKHNPEVLESHTPFTKNLALTGLMLSDSERAIEIENSRHIYQGVVFDATDKPMAQWSLGDKGIVHYELSDRFNEIQDIFDAAAPVDALLYFTERFNSNQRPYEIFQTGNLITESFNSLNAMEIFEKINTTKIHLYRFKISKTYELEETFWSDSNTDYIFRTKLTEETVELFRNAIFHLNGVIAYGTFLSKERVYTSEDVCDKISYEYIMHHSSEIKAVKDKVESIYFVEPYKKAHNQKRFMYGGQPLHPNYKDLSSSKCSFYISRLPDNEAGNEAGNEADKEQRDSIIWELEKTFECASVSYEVKYRFNE